MFNSLQSTLSLWNIGYKTRDSNNLPKMILKYPLLVDKSGLRQRQHQASNVKTIRRVKKAQ